MFDPRFVQKVTLGQVLCYRCNSTNAGYTLIHLTPTRCNHRPAEQEHTHTHTHTNTKCAHVDVLESHSNANHSSNISCKGSVARLATFPSSNKPVANMTGQRTCRIRITRQFSKPHHRRPFVSTKFTLNNSQLSPQHKTFVQKLKAGQAIPCSYQTNVHPFVH